VTVVLPLSYVVGCVGLVPPGIPRVGNQTTYSSAAGQILQILK
jgi:hypothetical protein